MNLKKLFILITMTAAALLSLQCGKKYDLYTENLPPSQKHFISTVRYLISSDEKKAFFALPDDASRDNFINNFWARRDNDPGTEENEFKIEYYKRIDEANLLFKGERKEGWLTDRGRVLVILGIPDFRRFNPGSISAGAESRQWYQLPNEVWYYGLYPIYFVDRMENGNLELMPTSNQFVSSLIQTSRELNSPAGKITKSPFSFALQLEKISPTELTIKVRIPIKNILFSQEKERFQAKLDFQFQITNKNEEKVHESKSQHTISITEEELKKMNQSDEYIVTFPVPVNLQQGEYILLTLMESQIDQIRTQQKINFHI